MYSLYGRGLRETSADRLTSLALSQSTTSSYCLLLLYWYLTCQPHISTAAYFQNCQHLADRPVATPVSSPPSFYHRFIQLPIYSSTNHLDLQVKHALLFENTSSFFLRMFFHHSFSFLFCSIIVFRLGVITFLSKE